MEHLLRKTKKTYVARAGLAAAFVIIAILYELRIINSYYMQVLMFAEINVIMTVSLNLVNGFTGQFSLGHATFMGIGAYSSAILTTLLFHTAGWSKLAQPFVFLAALLIGAVVAGFVGFLIALPSLNLKGDYLAIVTLAFGEIVKTGIRLIDYVGGPRGITAIPKYSNFYWITAITVISVMLIRNYIYSRFGRSSIAVRENEIAAQSMGINTTKSKISAFVVASFFAGLAGGLYAHLLMFIEPNLFNMEASINYLVYLYAGGMASISGSIVSAIVLSILPEMLRFLNNWRYVIYPLLLIVIMLRRQNGLLGGREFTFISRDRSEYLYKRPTFRQVFSRKEKTEG